MNSLDFPTRISLSVLKRMSHALGKVGHGSRGICILNYHRILQVQDPLFPDDPDIATFDRQMQVLARYFNVISLAEAVRDLQEGQVRPLSVCITFDDGYRSIHEFALPVLSRLGIPATVFVTSGYIDRGAMWNDRIIEAVRQYTGERLDVGVASLGTLYCHTLQSKRATCAVLIEHAKYLDCKQREQFTTLIEQSMQGAPIDNLMMTAAMLKDLTQHNFEIGAHTVNHPILASIDDEEAVKEITCSKQTLESILGKEVRFFAYPNGKFGRDFDMHHVEMVRGAGFMAAFTSANSGAAIDVHPYLIKRCMPWDRAPIMFGARAMLWLHR